MTAVTFTDARARSRAITLGGLQRGRRRAQAALADPLDPRHRQPVQQFDRWELLPDAEWLFYCLVHTRGASWLGVAAPPDPCSTNPIPLRAVPSGVCVAPVETREQQPDPAPVLVSEPEPEPPAPTVPVSPARQRTQAWPQTRPRRAPSWRRRLLSRFGSLEARIAYTTATLLMAVVLGSTM